MRRALLAVVAAVVAVGFSASAAAAHPLGNFTVNRFAGITVARGSISIHYALDLAEIPSFQELGAIDADHNSRLSDAELARYAHRKAAFLRDGLSLDVDGSRVSLALREAAASVRSGQGGLSVVRLDARFTSAFEGSPATLEYRDDNLPHVPGWKEVVASAGAGFAITTADVPSTSASDELHSYPATLLKRPPDVLSARVRVEAGSAAIVPTARTGARAARPYLGDGFAGLVKRKLSAGSLALALALAFAFGAVHALGPGHGKTVMSAYLLGDGRRAEAIGLGIVVSSMHTVSVIALGLVSLLLSHAFAPAVVYPWLGIVSGSAVVAIGVWLFRSRWRVRTAVMAGEKAHDHHHQPTPLSRAGLVAIATSGGLVPSPTAVVVLLGSIALHRIVFGLALIASFSAGLAAALMLTGLAALQARSILGRRLRLGPASVLPALSGLAIAAAGALLAVRAAMSFSA